MRKDRGVSPGIAERITRSVGVSGSDVIVGLLVLAGIVVGFGLIYLAILPASPPPYP